MPGFSPKSRLGGVLTVLFAGAASALLLVQYLRILRPAQARAVSAACTGMQPAKSNRTLGSMEGPVRALDFQAQDHTGKMVSLSQFRDRVVLLNFWASWCTVCKSEKPSLEEFSTQFDDSELVVLSLASDTSWDAVRKALPGGSPLNVLLDPPESDDSDLGPIALSYGLTAVPESFVIDREGMIRHYFINRRDWDSSVASICIRALINE